METRHIERLNKLTIFHEKKNKIKHREQNLSYGEESEQNKKALDDYVHYTKRPNLPTKPNKQGWTINE